LHDRGINNVIGYRLDLTQELMDRIGTPHAPMLFDVRRREVFDAADRLLGGANWRHHQEINAWIEEIPPSAEIVV